MQLKPLWEYFEKEIFPTPGTETLWNPYNGYNPEPDRFEGDKTRQTNFHNYLASFSRPPKIMLLGEAPGPWGCRFSGIAFTAERQMVEGTLPFNGQPTSTFNPPVAERSATVVWETLGRHHPEFFLWNTLPYHPHHPGKPLSIRTPKTSEISQFLHHLAEIINLLNPIHILAVGRKAEHALSKLNRPCTYIRHPSYGGTKLFKVGVGQFFS